MHEHRTDQPLIHAVDPASNRLSHDDVIAINKMHLEGYPWDEIARQHGTHRRHIARIVQGRRWADLHPSARPDLYRVQDVQQETRTAAPPSMKVADVQNLLDESLEIARRHFNEQIEARRIKAAA